MTNFTDIFGSMVFNKDVMRQRLAPDIFERLEDVMDNGGEMDPDVANAVAEAMMKWAMEKGATHYTHWFQPMTGITAEKHDSFIQPDGEGGVGLDFRGKHLIKGEPDASSFPSGGLRATFEARGYTAWDPTSFAFVKDGSLCIPTVFCSHSGEVLDKKTPLLRSTEAVCKEALRIVRLFGDTETKRIIATAGAEQEYFLIDRNLFNKREDLVVTGRTLFGAAPPKGQEMEDHYFGTLRPRVAEFMRDLDTELWKLGVYAKTKHNEVAPSQHELAPGYSRVNLAADHNQITMEIMKKVAERHGLACLLHEKPFRGVNGSGKHNNWSLATDTGKNLFSPGKEPETNRQFLLFMCAVIRAVDENQDLLRISVATAGNDRRLGGSEAPPAVISMFLGDYITNILTSVGEGHGAKQTAAEKMETGVSSVPEFLKDKSDRNRTSPFAFTGNKFEFRMPGSSVSIACPNVMINTGVADALRDFAERLEKADDFDSEVNILIAETMQKHKRIIFNGNNYSEEWAEEAKKRGLCCYNTAVDALEHYTDEKNLALFARHKIYTESEVCSRQEIMLENYSKVIIIEASTMADMVRKDIMPACLAFEKSLAETAAAKKAIGLEVAESTEVGLVKKIDFLCRELEKRVALVEARTAKAKGIAETAEQARYICDELYVTMHDLRAVADELETIVSDEFWPVPAYRDLLFSV
ncbi:MAG: glutamine synthetase III [Oscillospiraceae bacterium]|nr:glutamine synthetase III [Oscillospiraceae bacterium]